MLGRFLGATLAWCPWLHLFRDVLAVFWRGPVSVAIDPVIDPSILTGSARKSRVKGKALWGLA